MTLARHVDAPEKGHDRHRFTPAGRREAPRGVPETSNRAPQREEG